MANQSAARRPSAKDRLLSAADELFSTDGIQTVGIDRVIEHAGVAKASLYRSFDTKEALVAAYLDARHLRNMRRLRAAVDVVSDPRDRLLEVFATQGRWISAPNYRGCPFTRASAEVAPDGLVGGAVDDYRADVRTLMTELVGECGVAEVGTLVLQLEVLFHGSAVLVATEPRRRLAAAMHGAAAALIDAHIRTAR